MASQQQSLTRALPSYARPTAASESRRGATIQQDGTTTPARQHPRTRQESLLSTTLPASTALRRYMLPTASSRSKTRSSEIFRFLDLPAEIRNSIYEYIDGSSYRIVNLYRSRPDNTMVRLHALFAVNKQLRDEIGSFYFSKGYMLILISKSNFQRVKAWLRMIGEKNRKHLANNRNVWIRFVSSPTEVTYKNMQTLMSHLCLRFFTLGDAAQLTDLYHEFRYLAQVYPTMKQWQVQSLVLEESSLERPFTSLGVRAQVPLDAIPVSLIEQIRPVLDRMFKQLGGETVVKGSPTDWKFHPPEGARAPWPRGIYDLTTYSGQYMLLNPDC